MNEALNSLLEGELSGDVGKPSSLYFFLTFEFQVVLAERLFKKQKFLEFKLHVHEYGSSIEQLHCR